ncbi:MAG: hypothetical protein OEV64_08030 [Desulfobulbaceae bacterium]|nr:hypothetical protein [Desulfobulbaceae bacterium]
MKYLLYILASFMTMSLIVALFLLSNDRKDSSDEIALIINDKKITADEYRHPPAARMNHSAGDEDYLEAIIIRELLIQEAKRQGIDKEESFRISLQHFYEQSLVKLLMDRQYETLRVEINDEEISRYHKWLSGTVSFTMSTYTTHEDIKNGKPKAQESKTSVFNELSEFTQQQLFGLQPGQHSAPVHFLDDYLVFQLLSVELPDNAEKIGDKHESLRNKLSALKKEQLMSQWLNKLREDASISILLKGKSTVSR